MTCLSFPETADRLFACGAFGYSSTHRTTVSGKVKRCVRLFRMARGNNLVNSIPEVQGVKDGQG